MVLGLTGTEFIFFIAACMVLHFRSGTKTMLTAYQCFRYCWTVFAQHQALLCFSFSENRLECARAGGWGWGEGL